MKKLLLFLGVIASVSAFAASEHGATTDLTITNNSASDVTILVPDTDHFDCTSPNNLGGNAYRCDEPLNNQVIPAGKSSTIKLIQTTVHSAYGSGSTILLDLVSNIGLYNIGMWTVPGNFCVEGKADEKGGYDGVRNHEKCAIYYTGGDDGSDHYLDGFGMALATGSFGDLSTDIYFDSSQYDQVLHATVVINNL